MLNFLQTMPLTRREPLMRRFALVLLIGLYLHLALGASWLMMGAARFFVSSSWPVALGTTGVFFFVFTGPLALWAVVRRHGWVWMAPVLMLAASAGVLVDGHDVGVVFAAWASSLAALLTVLLPALVRRACRLVRPRPRP